MKRILSPLVLTALVCACAAPKKYAYHFDHYDYNSGRKDTPVNSPSSVSDAHNQTPAFVASADEAVPTDFKKTGDDVLGPKDEALKSEGTAEEEIKAGLERVRESYYAMDRAEKRAFRKDLKKEMKRAIREKHDAVDGVSATQVMDNDLKLAIIFGAVGLTLSLFAGISAAFWVLGVVSIVVGVVFLIKWVVRQ